MWLTSQRPLQTNTVINTQMETKKAKFSLPLLCTLFTIVNNVLSNHVIHCAGTDHMMYVFGIRGIALFVMENSET